MVLLAVTTFNVCHRAQEEMTPPPVFGKVYMASHRTLMLSRVKVLLLAFVDYRCVTFVASYAPPMATTGGVTNNGFPYRR